MRPKIPSIFLYDYAEYKGCTFFSSAAFNGLFRMKDDYSLKFMGRFPNEDLWKEHLHRNVFEYEGKLYFVPMLGKSIVVYDIEKNFFQEIELSGMKADGCFYSQAVCNGNELVLIPAEMKYPFVIFDLKNCKTSVIKGLNNSIRQVGDLEDISPLLCYSAVYFDGNILLSVPDTGIVVKITWGTWETKKYTLDPSVHLRSINEIDGVIYLNCKEPKLLSWIPDGKLERICIPSQDLVKEYPYLRTIKARNSLLLIPGQADSFLKYNKNTRVFSEVLPPGEFRRITDKLLFYSYKYKNDDTIEFFPRSGNGLLIYHIESNHFNYVDFDNNLENLTDLYIEWAEQVLKDKIIYEGAYDLNDYFFALDVQCNI